MPLFSFQKNTRRTRALPVAGYGFSKRVRLTFELAFVVQNCVCLPAVIGPITWIKKRCFTGMRSAPRTSSAHLVKPALFQSAALKRKTDP